MVVLYLVRRGWGGGKPSTAKQVCLMRKKSWLGVDHIVNSHDAFCKVVCFTSRRVEEKTIWLNFYCLPFLTELKPRFFSFFFSAVGSFLFKKEKKKKKNSPRLRELPFVNWLWEREKIVGGGKPIKSKSLKY